MPENERYIDPNSGAAPQPGGAAVIHELDPEQAEQEHPDGNVTEPGEERKLTKKQANDPTGGLEALPDELVFGGAHDTEVQNQAMPTGEPGPVAPYAAPGVATDEAGNTLGADGEPVTGEPEVEVEGADEQVTLDSTNTRIGGDLETTEGVGADAEGGADEGADEDKQVETDFDPSDHPGNEGVNAVVEYVEAHPNERQAILAKEKAGRNRSSLISKLEA